jgi:protein TonB
MVNDNKYFYLSGFISLFIFSFFISSAIYVMVSIDTLKQYALEKKEFISISIVIPKIQNDSDKKAPVKKDSNPVVIPLKKEEVKIDSNPVAPIKKKEVNIDNLFSEVLTKGIEKKKKVPEHTEMRRLDAIAKKVERTKEKKIRSIINKYKDKKIKNDGAKSSKNSSANEVNEYFAKIQNIVYKYFNPPQNSQGNTVKAVIKLGALGKVLDFRILQYSSSLELNNECDNIKQRLSSIVFPANPKNRSGSYTILLTAKE